MIEVSIPGLGPQQFRHLVMDYNGTMACDGLVFEGLSEALKRLDGQIDIHVLTADTFGKVRSEIGSLNLTISILPEGNQDMGKQDYVRKLGPESTVCIGNGRNDRLMLKHAGLGIVLLQEEGAHIETLLAADIVCRDIFDALNLLTNTGRLVATLRV